MICSYSKISLCYITQRGKDGEAAATASRTRAADSRQRDWRRDMYERFEDLPLSMSPKQYAEFTGENLNSVRRKLQKGDIPGDKNGGKWTIFRDVAFPNAARRAAGHGN